MSRKASELRPVKIKRRFTNQTPGSVLYQCGQTIVLCTASIDEHLPPWMADSGRGWITAEYSMLPGSTKPRKPRERDKPDGRTTEIQRLIGRSLRGVVDLSALGPRQITIDCDVLQADGGTRTASITGGFIALADAVQAIQRSLPNPKGWPIKDSVAAISVGIVAGKLCLDLNYEQDSAADVDLNLVMTGRGEFVEIQGTGEESTFSEQELTNLLKLGRRGIAKLTEVQQQTLGNKWQFA